MLQINFRHLKYQFNNYNNNTADKDNTKKFKQSYKSTSII